MHTVEITLEQVLLARDRRVQRQQALHRQYGGTLLSFTMNIAGPVKDTPLVRLAFRAGLAALDRDLGAPVHRESVAAPTGPEALLVYHRPAGAVKDLCLRLEEQAPVGRLYDLDVLSPGGEKLSRPQSRRCLICGGPVTVCSRSRAHGLAAIRTKTEDILRSFAAGHLAQLARQALEDEVCLTPKPGLVDRRNTGAHDDMDLPLFRRSAAALEPYFCRFVSLGMAGASPAELQALGREAEPYITRRGQKWHVDLKGVNARWLEKAGVTQIDMCPDCTACRPDLYWSHRRMGQARGAQIAMICL